MIPHLFRSLIAGALIVTAAAGPAYADSDRWAMNFTFENDLFGSGLDRHYTNGMMFTAFSPEGEIPERLDQLTKKIPFFPDTGKSRWSWGIGQKIFTPEDITIKERQDFTRPYAGWLYGSLGMVNLSDDGDHLNSIELNLGIVGPASLAEDAQTIWHQVIDSPRPEGWHSQLQNEPGVVLSYEYKRRNFRPIGKVLGYGTDVTPHVGASIGNIYTYGAAGVTIRFGNDLPKDYGPPRIRPSFGGSGFFKPGEKFSWYLFVGAEGRAVARNIFLDGNTIANSPRVDKKVFVGDLQAGLSVTFPQGMRMSASWVYRSREFDRQADPDVFGAINLSYAF